MIEHRYPNLVTVNQTELSEFLSARGITCSTRSPDGDALYISTEADKADLDAALADFTPTIAKNVV